MLKPNGTSAFHFKIDGFKPETLPMARLAEYMADLAALLGHEENVHFVKVAEGSADLVHVVDPDMQSSVIHRLHLIKLGDAPQDANKAFRAINEKLAEDRVSAKMMRGRGRLLNFEGFKAPKPITYDLVKQPGVLQGKVIKVGGKDGTKPVHLFDTDGRYYICNANAELAKRLAYYYEEYVRVYGTGKWSRSQDGQWALDHFDISNFEPLKDESLTNVVDTLRTIPGNGWRSIPDPLAELALVQHGGKVN